MSDGRKTERVRIVMAPGDLRVIDERPFARRIRSRSGAIRRLIWLGLEAEERRRPEVAAGVAS